MASLNPLQQVFDAAKLEFERDLPPTVQLRDIATVTSVDKLWDALDKLQQEQSKRTAMRNLARIQSFLNLLQGYAGAVEVFVQVKPSVLALIWGPIKLLLLWTSNWSQGFEAVVQTMERIGELLPQFQGITSIFIDKGQVKDVLGLLYRDLLDFYSETLKFFSLQSKARIMFEALWPKRKEKLKVVEANIERHARLLRDNITYEHIKSEHEARVKSFEEFRVSAESRLTQRFGALEAAISPRMYDQRLHWLRMRSCPGTFEWLAEDQEFRPWLDKSSQTPSLLWLQGIPGAGKTFLASWVAMTAKERGRTLYAFPSHVHTDTTALSIFHSLLFQLASGDADLQLILTDSNKRDLKSNLTAAKELLTNALRCAGGAFVVVDGLDEVEEFERKLFLTSLLDILNTLRGSPLRVCISSRAEHDITKILQPKATTIRIQDKNAVGIQRYVSRRFRQWMANADFSSEGQSEIQALLYPVAIKAGGMFLYARIVLDNVVDLTNIEEVRKELRALPEDLDAAYQRVLSRISRLSSRDQAKVKRILGWVGSAPNPLKIHELEQAMLVGSEAHEDAPTVDSVLNIVKLCGPIIEVVDETPRLVHFTVKEYIFSPPNQLVSIREAVMDLLVTCLTYLCYDALGEDLEEDQLRENLLAGKYRFQVFASSWWFTMVKKYTWLTRKEKDLSVINGLMQNLFSERENPRFGDGAENETQLGRQEPPQLPWPEAPEFIADTLRFYSDSPEKDLWTFMNCFATSNALSLHRKRLHKIVRETALTQPSMMEDEALYPLLYELVWVDSVDEFKAVWPSCRQKVNQFTEAELLMMAAAQGSLPIVQLLLDWNDDEQKPRNQIVKFHNLVHDALQSGNLELTRWILAEATAWGCVLGRRYRDIVIAVLKSDSAEVFSVWEDVVTSVENFNLSLAQELFEKSVLNSAAKFPDQEARMLGTWRRLAEKNLVRPEDLGRALTMVAQTTLSIDQARVLLELGAPIEHPQVGRGKGYTALHWACKTTSNESALFIKFLLLEGANPRTHYRKYASDEEGARKIETWLNLTWDELVKRATRKRKGEQR